MNQNCYLSLIRRESLPRSHDDVGVILLTEKEALTVLMIPNWLFPGRTVGVHSHENFSPHSIAYKNPQREHSTATFCKRQQYNLYKPRHSNPKGHHSAPPSPTPAPPVPGALEQTYYFHLCNYFCSRDAEMACVGS